MSDSLAVSPSCPFIFHINRAHSDSPSLPTFLLLDRNEPNPWAVAWRQQSLPSHFSAVCAGGTFLFSFILHMIWEKKEDLISQEKASQALWFWQQADTSVRSEKALSFKKASWRAAVSATAEVVGGCRHPFLFWSPVSVCTDRVAGQGLGHSAPSCSAPHPPTLPELRNGWHLMCSFQAPQIDFYLFMLYFERLAGAQSKNISVNGC